MSTVCICDASDDRPRCVVGVSCGPPAAGTVSVVVISWPLPPVVVTTRSHAPTVLHVVSSGQQP